MPDVEWINLKAKQLRDLGATGTTIAIVPVGSIEQHGPHLPVQVDALLVGEVARRTARLVAQTDPIVVVPTIWSGLAEHHMSLGGTLTLDLPTFHALIRCVVTSLVRNGFRKIVLVNGHGGNMTGLNAIVGELERRTSIADRADHLLGRLAEAEFARILEAQTTVKHACEAETSMVLALRPDLVAMAIARRRRRAGRMGRRQVRRLRLSLGRLVEPVRGRRGSIAPQRPKRREAS